MLSLDELEQLIENAETKLPWKKFIAPKAAGNYALALAAVNALPELIAIARKASNERT